MDNICLECGSHLIGRVDKKFCNDLCKNNYYNKRNRDETAYMRKVSRALRKNRSILKDLNPNGKVSVNISKLESKGFNFKYFTNTYTTKTGKTYYFCYEYGYLPLDKGFYALVINKDI
ncbi:MAG: hypothetical protein C0598_03145 [Marinilabiliales bacterium]|nr:MAG: hypothetical protein C0598_03145 [Marinilabiliales bacterium]